MENAEMLAQVWDGFSSTTMTHTEFTGPLFPEWVRLDVAACDKIILAFTDSQPLSSSEEGAFVPLNPAPRIFFSPVESAVGFLLCPDTGPIDSRKSSIKAVPGTPELPGGIPAPLGTRGLLQ